MAKLTVKDATLKGSIKGATFTGTVDGLVFSGDVTYADVVVVPPIVLPPVDPPPVTGGTAPVITYARTVSSQNKIFNVQNGGSTQSNNMAVFGTAPASAAIAVYRGSTNLGSTTADSSGKWNYELGILLDGVQTITATANGSAASAAFNFIISPSVKGVPIGQNLNDSVDFEYIGQMWSAQNDSSNPSALIASDTHTLNFTCRPQDNWKPSPSNRSEMQNFNDKTNGTTFNWTYEFYMPTSDPINNAGVHPAHGGLDGSLCLGQLWSPGGPTFMFVMGDGQNGDALGTVYRDPNQHWLFASSNLSRGVWHRMDVIAKPAASGGFVMVWVDGVLILNASKLVDPQDPNHYNIQFGYYRHPTTGNTQTQHVSYRNMLLTYS